MFFNSSTIPILFSLLNTFNRMETQSVTYVLALFPRAKLDRAVRINKLTFTIFGTLLEVADVNRSIRIKLSSITTNLVLLVLGLQDLVVGKDHAVDAVGDVGSFSELTKPLGPLFIDHLFEFEIVAVEVEGLLNVLEEILYGKGTQLFPIL